MSNEGRGGRGSAAYWLAGLADAFELVKDEHPNAIDDIAQLRSIIEALGVDPYAPESYGAANECRAEIVLLLDVGEGSPLLQRLLKE